jgi:glucose/mannose-6-phosphate isomerase
MEEAVVTILDDPAAIARADAHRVGDVLAAFADHCRQALRLAPRPAPAEARPRAVVVAGMGGSASGGDLLAACAGEHLEIPIVVHRGYGLPGFAGRDDLVIASSYSGDTAETLSAAETALGRGCALVGVTSGGRLGQLLAARGRPCVTLPGGLMPRMAVGLLLMPLLGVLRTVGLTVAKDADIEEALAVLDGLAEACGPAAPAARNEAKRLAAALHGRLPVVYGGPLTGAAAYRLKTDLEENAKTLAVAGALPEMNHNEIEAWGSPDAAARHLVLLRDDGEPVEIGRRFAVLRELVGGHAGGVSEVRAQGSGRLARLLSLVALGQWTSYYLALLRGVDPWAIPVLDALKARMRAAPAP